MGDDLLLTAGGDAVFVLDALPDGAADLARRAQAEGSLVDADGPHRSMIDRLVSVGALRPVAGPAPLPCAVEAAGIRDVEVARALAEALQPWRSAPVADSGPGSGDDALRIVVRARSDRTALTEVAAGGAGVLLVDLAYERSIGIGPWWSGPATSCPACYLARLEHRWGTVPLPERPDVTRWMPAIAALVAVQVEAIENDRSGLVNRSISWDLHDGRSEAHAVLKVPWCANCGGHR